MLFTCRWLPENEDPKALVFLCHGYAMESSISMQGYLLPNFFLYSFIKLTSRIIIGLYLTIQYFSFHRCNNYSIPIGNKNVSLKL